MRKTVYIDHPWWVTSCVRIHNWKVTFLVNRWRHKNNAFFRFMFYWIPGLFWKICNRCPYRTNRRMLFVRIALKFVNNRFVSMIG